MKKVVEFLRKKIFIQLYRIFDEEVYMVNEKPYIDNCIEFFRY